VDEHGRPPTPDAGPPPAEVILGVDVGTSGAKVVAFGLTRPWRRSALREYPLLEPVPGQQVQDPATVVAAVLAAVGECVAACDGARVAGVAVTTAMHALLGLDASHRAVTPLVTWADARALEEARQLRGSTAGAGLHRRTGTPLHPMSPLAKLRWFTAHERQLTRQVRWWVGLKALILWHLTGVLTTELSTASATGLLDRHRRTWDPEALELAGITADHLPAVGDPMTSLPLTASAAARTGLPVGTPVVLGAADGPLANLGTRATAPGVVGLSLGTSGAARMIVAPPPADLDPALFCYALTGSEWVVGSAISTGGIVVRWAGSALAPDLVDGAGLPDDARLLELAAVAPPGSDGLVMLPFLLAERAPAWDPSLRGAYLGLRRRHTRAHLVRAAIEGVALQLALIVDQLDRVRPVAAIRATGGTFRSSLWREVVAAALDRPLTLVGQEAGSALGAAALGLVAVGRSTSLDAAVEQLAPVAVGDDVLVVPDPALVAASRAVRATIPGLVRDLARSAARFEDEARPGRPAAEPARRHDLDLHPHLDPDLDSDPDLDLDPDRDPDSDDDTTRRKDDR
jgi:gluconokinase